MSSITTAVAADYRLQQWVQLVKVWIYTTLKLDLSNFDTSNVFYHMNLHYSQTGRKGTNWWIVFFYHMSLHYSQTIVCIFCLLCWFFYHMNLHYSQTSNPILTEQTCSYITWVHSHDNVFILTFIDNTHIFIYNSYSFLLNNIIIIVVFN